MHIVTGSTGDALPVHHALDEIVTLHPVLVRCPIREVCEGGLPQRVIFELPVVREMESGAIADRPIVSLALDLLGEGLPLWGAFRR